MLAFNLDFSIESAGYEAGIDPGEVTTEGQLRDSRQPDVNVVGLWMETRENPFSHGDKVQAQHREAHEWELNLEPTHW